jgi:hypothetical protein
MFLHSYLVQQACGVSIDPLFRQRLTAMFEWISTLADGQGRLPHIGDCDDGRVELLFDDIRQIALPVEQRHSLSVANHLGVGSHALGKSFGGEWVDAAWFGSPPSGLPARRRQRVELLANSGVAVAHIDDADLLFTGMPNGIAGRGSHTHSDKLSFVLRLAGADVFCDSGTRCYTRDAGIRNRYRSVAAHNVLAVDMQEQNTTSQSPDRLFHSGNEAAVTPISVNANNGAIVLSSSHSGYQRFGILCSRTLHFKKNQLTINDEIQGSGDHNIDLFFQIAPGFSVDPDVSDGTNVACAILGARSLVLRCRSSQKLQLRIENSEISRAYGAVSPAMRIRIDSLSMLPATLVTEIQWN